MSTTAGVASLTTSLSVSQCEVALLDKDLSSLLQLLANGVVSQMVVLIDDVELDNCNLGVESTLLLPLCTHGGSIV